MKLNLEEYYKLMEDYYYSEPRKYTPENDFDITPEEMVLINELWHRKRMSKGDPETMVDTDEFCEYSYYDPYYLEWIASSNPSVSQKKDVDWTKVLSDKRGKTTEIFDSPYYGMESPWWTSDKYKSLYEKHRNDVKAYYYRCFKEEEHRKAENKAAQLIRRARKKAEKDYKNGK